MKTKRSWIIIGLIVMASFILGFLTFDHLNKQPRDLGPELEYIGKSEYGCWMPGFCDSGPATSYYFATNLSLEELKTYFKDAKPISSLNIDQPLQTPKRLFFTTNGDKWVIVYYSAQEVLEKNPEVARTKKPFVISMDSSTFPKARRGLAE